MDTICALSFSFLVFAELFIERFCMTGGNSPIGYLKAYHTNLYLSADPIKVREALEEGQYKDGEARKADILEGKTHCQC